MAQSKPWLGPDDRPGGEACPAARARPIDLQHLSRQTLGDRAIEQEVLALFLQQANAVRDRFAGATVAERLRLAHGLKGSALGVGAFTIADWTNEVEASPENRQAARRLTKLIDEVRDFVAAISR